MTRTCHRAVALVALFALLAAVEGARAVGPNNALNDTGINRFGNDSSNTLDSEPATHPGQDAGRGRDAGARAGTLAKVGAGISGFDFTRIANNGTVLTANAAFGTGSLDWGCTYDNVTGLMWEIKLNNPAHLRHWYFAYNWYDSNPATNGGVVGGPVPGTPSNACLTAGRCDTEKFAQDVNAAGMCGHQDWRLPSVHELASIIDYSVAVTPTIDAGYFPNTLASGFWTASVYVEFNGANAWFVNFYYGRTEGTIKTAAAQVRLVREGK